MGLTLLTIIVLSSLTAMLFLHARSDDVSRYLAVEEAYTLDHLLEKVKLSLNDMTRSQHLGKHKQNEHYKRWLNKRSELMNALRMCIYGSHKDKQFVKDVIYDLLQHKLLEPDNIDRYIPFNQAGLLTSTERFDIILYHYKKMHQDQALTKLIKTYDLDRLKPSLNQMGGHGYYITPDEIDQIYYTEMIHLTYDDKLKLIAQRIYQMYKGFSVIDEIRDMSVDGVSGGVSGTVEVPDKPRHWQNTQAYQGRHFDSVWLFFQGKSIHLSFMSFGSEHELKRVCQNLYRYNNSGMLSQKVGYKVNEMMDGSRVVVVRPDFSESWAFFIRKFHMSHVKLSDLVKGEGASEVVQLISYLAKGGRITSITGSQGSGKTTMLMAMIGEIYETLTLRVQEMAFELNLRKLYPNRNILTFKETATITGQMGLDVQKKTDGSVNILGEVASDEVAAWMIQMAQVASLFTLFTHHAKTVKDLVLSLRNSLLKCDVFRNETIAEEQVVSVLNFDIHLSRDYSGRRYIERITEIIPMPSHVSYTPIDPKCPELMGQFAQHATTFFQRMTDRVLYETRDIMVYRDGAYVPLHPISNKQRQEMREAMMPSDQLTFDAYLKQLWGGYDANQHHVTHRVI